MIGGNYQRHMFQLMRSIGDGSANGAFAAMVKVLSPPSHINLERFKQRFEADIQSYIDVASDSHSTMREKSAGRLILITLALFREFGIHLPAAVVRLYRSLLITDSVVIQLTPHLDVIAELRHALRQIGVDRLLAQLTSDRFVPALLGYANILLEIPAAATELLESRLLSEAVSGIRTLETSLQRIRRLLARAASSLIFAVAIVLLLATVAKFSRAPIAPEVIGLQAIPVRNLLIGAAVAMFASRWVRARIR
jgi:predicted unusual protein kinase regulating ubiquinone biosynthesis (AarF/ABC1/UbiB family)